MKLVVTLVALALLSAGTAASFAQSQPNYGPDGPAAADTFGTPPSGTHPPGTFGYARGPRHVYDDRYMYDDRYRYRHCWYRHHHRWCE